jgi:hypothetical protein
MLKQELIEIRESNFMNYLRILNPVEREPITTLTSGSALPEASLGDGKRQSASLGLTTDDAKANSGNGNG